MVECRTPEREVRGSRPTAAVLCPWARHFTPRKYWLITQEAMAPSRHDWKIVDWDVKPQHNQANQERNLFHLRMASLILLWEICPRELPHTATLYQVKPYLQMKQSSHLDWGRLRVVSKVTPFLLIFNMGVVAGSEACSLGMQAAPSSIPTSGTFFRGDVVIKTFLQPFSLFRWFKKSSCQLLAKVCALSTGKLPRRLAQEQCD